MQNLYKFNKEMIYQKVGETSIIFDGNNLKLHTVNSTAECIISLIKKNKSKSQILSYFLSTFAVSERAAKHDIEACILYLLKNNILLKKKITA